MPGLFDSIAGILGGLGGITQSVGDNTSPDSKSATISGYSSLPQAQQDFLQRTLFPAIQKYAATPYQGIAKRAINSTDTDPIFGSPARVAYTQQMAAKTAQAPATPMATPAPATSQTDLSSLAQHYLTQLRDPNGHTSMLENQVNQGIIPIANLGKTLVAKGYNGNQSGAINPTIQMQVMKALGMGG